MKTVAHATNGRFKRTLQEFVSGGNGVVRKAPLRREEAALRAASEGRISGPAMAAEIR